MAVNWSVFKIQQNRDIIWRLVTRETKSVKTDRREWGQPATSSSNTQLRKNVEILDYLIHRRFAFPRLGVLLVRAVFERTAFQSSI